jgi:hypothetical protein
MNIDYLQKEIIPQRNREIEDGKNLDTRQPIYVVMDMRTHITEGHSEYLHTTNEKDREKVWGYADFSLYPEEREFKKTAKGMEQPKEITEFYTDHPVAFFLTSRAAYEYLQYQRHNLSKEAYVYVFHSGYRNREMDNLLMKASPTGDKSN